MKPPHFYGIRNGISGIGALRIHQGRYPLVNEQFAIENGHL